MCSVFLPRGLRPPHVFAWLGVCLLLTPPQSSAQTPGDAIVEHPTPLQTGHPIHGTLDAGTSHRWRLSPAATEGRRLRLVSTLERPVLRLLAKDGSEWLASRPLFGFGWSHELPLPPTQAGWSVEVQAKAGAPVGDFVLALIDASSSADERNHTDAHAARQLTDRVLPDLDLEDAESHDQALDDLNAALDAWQQVGDHEAEVRIRLVMARLVRPRDAPAASHHLARALVTANALAESPLRALVLDQLGHAHLAAGQLDNALRSFKAAAKVWQRLDLPGGETLAQGSACIVLIRQGAWRTAETCLQTTIADAEHLDLVRMAARLGISLGGVASHLGEPDIAIDAYGKALEHTRRLDDVLGESQTRNNLGALHRRLGEPSVALTHYRAALEGFEQLGHLTWQARTLNNLGYAYLDLGNPERARPILHRALALRREAGDRRGEAVTLRNLARSLADGDLPQAFSRAQDALALADALGDVRSQASTLELLGQLAGRAGDTAAGLEHLARAFERRSQIGDALGVARIRLEQVPLERLQAAGTVGQRAQHLQGELLRALETFLRFGDVAGEMATRVALAEHEVEGGRWDAALEQLDIAMQRMEVLRTRIADPAQRASFLGARRQAFALGIDIHLTLHQLDPAASHDRFALEISERGRARSLLDALDRPGGPTPNLESGLWQRWRRARRLLEAKVQRRAQRLGSDLESEERDALDTEVEAAQAGLEEVATEIRSQRPDLSVAATSTLRFEEMRRLLDSQTGLLEIALGERRSVAWWLTDQALTVIELPSRRRLEELATLTHQQLQTFDLNRRATRRDGAQRLATALLTPLSEHLNRRRIVVVADGALHAVPWAALPDPRSAEGRALMYRHEVVSVPSASALGALRRTGRSAGPGDLDSVRSLKVAILADPVFDASDPRNPSRTVASAASRQLGRSYDRLPHSRDEALSIAQQVGKDARLFLGLDAHLDLLFDGSLKPFDILHVASHGVPDPDSPELSGILLSRIDRQGHSQDAVLRSHDVLALDLEAHLVVLSGCGTALGKPVSGEGFLGLAHAFLDAGVPQVVASLWPVDDRATAHFMEHLYRHLDEPDTSAATALHLAQQALVATERWSDPYFWGAFTLQGDWRPRSP